MPPALPVGSYSYGAAVVPSDSVNNIRFARYLVNTGTSGVFYVRQNFNGLVLNYPNRESHPGVAKNTVWSSAGAGFVLLGQPQNDGLEFVSSSAGDTTQSVTIYGTTTATNTLVKEVLALNGTNQVSTTKTDWGFILGLELTATCAGTITAREASGNVTLTTIAIGSTSKGVYTVPIVGVQTVLPVVYADAATTKVVGVYGTNTSDSAAGDSITLAGVTKTNLNSNVHTVTKFLVGDLETARTAYLQLGSYLKQYLPQGGSVECGSSWLGVNSTDLGTGVELQAFY